MAAEEPGPLPRGLLDRLASRPTPGHRARTPACWAPVGARGIARASLLAADLAVLQDSGYLKLALPARFGGAGLSLADLACAQRQLAARAPATARAVNAHHAWIGAAADALARRLATDAGRGSWAGRAGRPGCWARPPGAGYSRLGARTASARARMTWARATAGRHRAGTGWPGGGWTRPAGWACHRLRVRRAGGGELPAGGPAAAGRAGQHADRRDVRLGAGAGRHDQLRHRPPGVRAGGGAGSAGRAGHWTGGRWPRRHCGWTACAAGWTK